MEEFVNNNYSGNDHTSTHFHNLLELVNSWKTFHWMLFVSIDIELFGSSWWRPLMQHFPVLRKWISRVVVELGNKGKSLLEHFESHGYMHQIYTIKVGSSWRHKTAEEMKCQFCWPLSHIYILYTVNITIRLSLRHIRQI